MVSIEDMGNTIRVIGICGSLRGGSYTRKALQLALKGAEEVGANTQLMDLRDYDLIFCDGLEEDDVLTQDVHRMRKEVHDAQGIILGTPEYHGGYSGVLKNALDLMGFDEFEGKMIGLVGVSGGNFGATNAMNSLRTVGRSLHAWVIPNEVSIPRASRMFNEDGKLNDDELAERIKDLGREVARFAFLHHSKKALDFVQLWEGATLNPGGEKSAG